MKAGLLILNGEIRELNCERRYDLTRCKSINSQDLGSIRTMCSGKSERQCRNHILQALLIKCENGRKKTLISARTVKADMINLAERSYQPLTNQDVDSERKMV